MLMLKNMIWVIDTEWGVFGLGSVSYGCSNFIAGETPKTQTGGVPTLVNSQHMYKDWNDVRCFRVGLEQATIQQKVQNQTARNRGFRFIFWRLETAVREYVIGNPRCLLNFPKAPWTPQHGHGTIDCAGWEIGSRKDTGKHRYIVVRTDMPLE